MMTSDDMNDESVQPSPESPTEPTPEPEGWAGREDAGSMPMTARERRRRIAALILLLLLLLMLALGAWYWYSTRMVPLPVLERDAELLNPPQYLFSITGSGANTLDRPVGVDVGPNGRVYVVDFTKRRVSVFDRSGRYLFAFNEVDGGELGNPVHLQVQGNEVWVTDRRLRGIYVFDLDGTFKRRFEPKNEEDLDWTPLALDFDTKGQLRVTDVGDTRKHRLLYFSEDGSRTATIGKTVQVDEPNADPGAFYFPNGVAVARNGRVYVSDGDNRRVQVFDDKGEFKQFVNTSGVPRGLAIDAERRLFVVDALAHQVDVYGLDGTPLTQFGARGFGPGEFNFPNDIAVDATGRIYVSDRENNQVQVWAWPQLVVPASVVPDSTWQWALCFSPLLLLPLLLLLRKRRYVLSPDFLAVLVETGRAEALTGRKLRFIAPQEDEAVLLGMDAGGVDLARYVEFEPHSPSDVAALRDKLRCTEKQAIYLSMADRVHGLLSEDDEMHRFGILVRVKVLDVQQFLDEVGAKRGDSAGSV